MKRGAVPAVSTDEPEPESALVARAIQRDAAAFTELYERYVERVYRYIRLKTGNSAEAEDLLSTVFLRAWWSIGRFHPKGETSFAAWVFRLAHNAVVDGFRRPRDTVSYELASEEVAAQALSSNPELHLQWRLTVEELHHALAALTEEQREVVLLRFVEGLSAREAGSIMCKHEGTIRGLQFRAIQALRKALLGPDTKAGADEGGSDDD
jgi:RNA polymerase sigma-70 factor (ECF subfamily)